MLLLFIYYYYFCCRTEVEVENQYFAFQGVQLDFFYSLFKKKLGRSGMGNEGKILAWPDAFSKCYRVFNLGLLRVAALYGPANMQNLLTFPHMAVLTSRPISNL